MGEEKVVGVGDPGKLDWGCWSIGIAGALCKELGDVNPSLLLSVVGVLRP